MYSKNRKFVIIALSVFLLSLFSFSFISSAQAMCETYNESPMLAEMVAAGELPPVEERLPVNPRQRRP